MNKKKVIYLLGKKGSPKQQLFNLITKENEEFNLLNYLEPIYIDCINNSSIYLFNIPEVEDLNDLNMALNILTEYSNKSDYQLIQIFYCVKSSENINQEIQDFLSILNKFVWPYYFGALTFIINQNKFEKHMIEINKINYSHLINLNEVTDNQIGNEVRKILSNIGKENILLKSPSNLDDQFIYVKQFIQSQKILIEEKLQEHENAGMFLDSLKNLKVQLKSYNNKDQIPKQINYFCELLLLKIEFMSVFTKKEELAKKWSSLSPYENCVLCSRCFLLTSLDNKVEYKLTQPFQFHAQEKNHIKINICYSCSEQTTNKPSDFYQFLKNAILNQTVTQYFEYITSNQEREAKKKQLNNRQDIQRKQQYTDLVNEIYIKQRNDLTSPLLIEKPQNTEKQYTPMLQQRDCKIQTITKQNHFQIKLFSLFISCEQEERSFVFSKLNYPRENYRMNQQFPQSRLINGKYTFFDSPCFPNEEEFQQSVQQFKEFLSKQEIHFIFLFLDYERTDQMKKKLNYMLLKLHEVDRSSMALVITNWQKHSERKEENVLREFASIKKLQHIIFTQINDSADLILTEFLKCLDISDQVPLSFANTLFGEQTDEVGQEEIDSNLKLLEQTIMENYEKEQKEKLCKLKNSKEYLVHEKEQHLLKIQEIDDLNSNLNQQIFEIEYSLLRLSGAKKRKEYQTDAFVQLKRTYLKIQD